MALEGLMQPIVVVSFESNIQEIDLDRLEVESEDLSSAVSSQTF
jgi:hypothetical protein